METRAIPFPDHCGRVQERVEQVYGVKVVIKDIPDPRIGDFDGSEIHLDQAVTQEHVSFYWLICSGTLSRGTWIPLLLRLGKRYQPPVDEGLFPKISESEFEAPSYGLERCHEAHVGGIEEWFSAYTACDQT